MNSLLVLMKGISLSFSYSHFRQVELDIMRNESSDTKDVHRCHQELSERTCVTCGQGFSLPSNRRLSCGSCKLGVCRKCSVWDAKEKHWNCQPCKNKRQDIISSYLHIMKLYCDHFFELEKKKKVALGPLILQASFLNFHFASKYVCTTGYSSWSHLSVLCKHLEVKNIPSLLRFLRCRNQIMKACTFSWLNRKLR